MSVLDPIDHHPGARVALGPFDSHAQALARVADVRAYARERFPWSALWAFGTIRLELGSDQVGTLNDELLREESRPR